MKNILYILQEKKHTILLGFLLIVALIFIGIVCRPAVYESTEILQVARTGTAVSDEFLAEVKKNGMQPNVTLSLVNGTTRIAIKSKDVDPQQARMMAEAMGQRVLDTAEQVNADVLNQAVPQNVLVIRSEYEQAMTQLQFFAKENNIYIPRQEASLEPREYSGVLLEYERLQNEVDLRKSLYLSQLKQFHALQAKQLVEAKILTSATMPDRPLPPQKSVLVLSGSIAGGVLLSVYVLVIYKKKYW